MNKIFLEILILIFLFLFYAILNSIEIALVSLNKLRIKALEEKGDKRAKIISKLVENPNEYLSVLVVGINSTIIIATAIITHLSNKFLRSEITSLTIIIWTIFVLTFGELIPKSITTQKAEFFALNLSFLIKIIIKFFSPFVRILIFIANFIVRPIPLNKIKEPYFVTEEEIKKLATIGEEEGAIEEEEKKIIHSIFEFSDTTVEKVMIPHIDVTFLEVNTPLKEAIDTIINKGHSRIPVYEETIDRIIGILYAKDILKYLDKDVKLKDILRPVYFVPEHKKISELFKEMRKERVHIAVVVDEYGGTSGIVTMEDLIEEIVGEIQDEYDMEESFYTKITENSYLVDGRLSIEDAKEKLGINLEVKGVNTIGGFIYNYLGRIPQVKEEIELEDFKIIIEKVERQRISKVKIIKK
jgi:CBS domain containing-hemolysin-like protein